MRRQAWSIILGAVITAAGLPGCALMGGVGQLPPGAQPSPTVVGSHPLSAEQKQLSTSFLGQEESELRLPDPAGPHVMLTPVQQANLGFGPNADGDPQASLALGQTPKSQQPVPPGQNLPDFADPPQVRPQLSLPPAQQPASNPFQLPDLNSGATIRTLHESPPAPLFDKTALMMQALRALLNKQPEEALKQLQTFDPANRELAMRLLAAVALLNDKNGERLTAAESAALEEQVQSLLGDLRKRAELTIEKMVLCERIDGCGQYKALPPGYAFQADARQRVKVYVELRNLTCELHDQYYVSDLKRTLTITDAAGMQVWIHNFSKREQNPQPVTDSFRDYEFNPPPLQPGRYTLTLEFTDQLRQPARVARKSVEMILVAGAPPQ
jgi:hypothetical protein